MRKKEKIIQIDFNKSKNRDLDTRNADYMTFDNFNQELSTLLETKPSLITPSEHLQFLAYLYDTFKRVLDDYKSNEDLFDLNSAVVTFIEDIAIGQNQLIPIFNEDNSIGSFNSVLFKIIQDSKFTDKVRNDNITEYWVAIKRMFSQLLYRKSNSSNQIDTFSVLNVLTVTSYFLEKIQNSFMAQLPQELTSSLDREINSFITILAPISEKKLLIILYFKMITSQDANQITTIQKYVDLHQNIASYTTDSNILLIPAIEKICKETSGNQIILDYILDQLN